MLSYSFIRSVGVAGFALKVVDLISSYSKSKNSKSAMRPVY